MKKHLLLPLLLLIGCNQQESETLNLKGEYVCKFNCQTDLCNFPPQLIVEENNLNFTITDQADFNVEGKIDPIEYTFKQDIRNGDCSGSFRGNVLSLKCVVDETECQLVSYER